MKRKAKSDQQREPPMSAARIAAIALLLAVLASVPYLRTVGHDFVQVDDGLFVRENPRVAAGLSWDGVIWAFTSFHAANWVPLSWLSHMLDVTLFGMTPGMHHFTNVLLHAAACALLFLALFRMTGATRPSVFAAALFGVHPLHVESVAWIAERRDVLSGLFFMLVLLSYERYARKGGARRYLAVLLFLALGLLAKPMLVTVPLVLLLLDVWPLGRTKIAPPADGSVAQPAFWSSLIIEKAPMAVLSALAAAVTFAAQRSGGAMSAMEHDLLPFAWRLANALVAYAAYLGKLFWPSSLGVFYLHPGTTIPLGKIAGSAALLFAVSAFIFRQGRVRAYLPVGWLWFLGMLVPVIGLLQVGLQSHADRYAYLPFIGLYMMVAWSGAEAAHRLGNATGKTLAMLAAGILALLLTISTVQAGRWRNSVTLFEQAAAVAPDNWLAHRSLGKAYADQGRRDEAVAAYRTAVRLRPQDARAHNNLAVELAEQGRYEEAIGHYQEAIRLRPGLAEAHNNLGNALAALGRRSEALAQYQEAIRLRPGWSVAERNRELLSGKRVSGGK